MGQGDSKGSTSTSTSSTSSKKSSSSFPPSDLDSSLASENAELKRWAASVSIQMKSAVLLYEGIMKRRNVYTSGKKCGDSDEKLADQLVKSGEILVEKYTDEPPGGVVDFEGRAKTLDLTKLEAFDDFLDELRNFICQKKNDNVISDD